MNASMTTMSDSWSELFRATSIDAMVEGRTNAPLAVRDGWTSEATLGKIVEQTRLAGKRWGEPNFVFDKTDWPAAVLRVNKSGEADYIISAGYWWFPQPTSINCYHFSQKGELVSIEKGRSFKASDFGLSIITAGFYAVARALVPSVRTNAQMAKTLKGYMTSLNSQNREDADRAAAGVTVYLEGPESVAHTLSKEVMPVALPGPAQFFEATYQKSLQVMAALVGANAIVSYQKASPSRGTPAVII